MLGISTFMSPDQIARSRLAPSIIDAYSFVPGTVKSDSTEEELSALLNRVEPVELVTVRSLKSASSPLYSRKPTVPVAYAVLVSDAIWVPSSETVIVDPDTVVLTVCQVPASSEVGSDTVPSEL